MSRKAELIKFQWKFRTLKEIADLNWIKLTTLIWRYRGLWLSIEESIFKKTPLTLQKEGKQKCYSCKYIYTINSKNFFRDTLRSSWFWNECKKCCIERKKIYYNNNKKEINERRRKKRKTLSNNPREMLFRILSREVDKSKSWNVYYYNLSQKIEWYVYLIKSNSRYKIWKTNSKKTQKNRIMHLQSWNPEKIFFVGSKHSKNCNNLEYNLHMHFKNKRWIWERFQLDNIDILYLRKIWFT